MCHFKFAFWSLSGLCAENSVTVFVRWSSLVVRWSCDGYALVVRWSCVDRHWSCAYDRFFSRKAWFLVLNIHLFSREVLSARLNECIALNKEYQKCFHRTKLKLRENPKERQFEFRYVHRFRIQSVLIFWIILNLPSFYPPGHTYRPSVTARNSIALWKWIIVRFVFLFSVRITFLGSLMLFVNDSRRLTTCWTRWKICQD